jgi:alpha-beta hydrolase superfamily lysophospholipase
MGGALALRAHLKEPCIWDGAILVAPMCKIVKSMYPSPMMVQFLTMLAQVIPKAKLVYINNIMRVGFRDEVKRKLISD